MRRIPVDPFPLTVQRGPVNEMIKDQKRLMERSGLGLLPGLALALAIVLVAMAALVLETWWITVCVVAVLILATGAVVWVVLKIADDGPDQQT